MEKTISLKKLYESSHSIISELLDEEPRDFRLEQVDAMEESDISVVVSYLMNNTNQNTGKTSLGLALSNLSLPYERVYKKIQLDKDLEFRRLLMYEHK